MTQLIITEGDGNLMTTLENISVIIRSKNEERWVGHCIQSVLENLELPEIILVDNNSSDKTVEVVRSFQKDPDLESNGFYTDIKISSIDNYSPGRALNKGISLASNKYILIISSHCVLSKFNLKKHIKDLNEYAAIFGNQIPVHRGKKINKRYLWSHFIDEEVTNMFSDMEERYFFHNALSFFKSETLRNFPFDEHLVGKEDRYWARDIINSGEKILYDPEMEVNHHYTDNGNTWKGIG